MRVYDKFSSSVVIMNTVDQKLNLRNEMDGLIPVFASRSGISMKIKLHNVIDFVL